MYCTKLSKTAVVPERKTEGAAGYDLYASEDTIIPSQHRALVSTGIAIKLPQNSVGIIKSRSSMACKEIDACAGVIDSDYRGEVKVLLHNTSYEDYEVKTGARVAQLLVMPILTLPFVLVDDLEKTKRGKSGFGSTGE